MHESQQQSNCERCFPWELLYYGATNCNPADLNNFLPQKMTFTSLERVWSWVNTLHCRYRPSLEIVESSLPPKMLARTTLFSTYTRDFSTTPKIGCLQTTPFLELRCEPRHQKKSSNHTYILHLLAPPTTTSTWACISGVCLFPRTNLLKQRKQLLQLLSTVNKRHALDLSHKITLVCRKQSRFPRYPRTCTANLFFGGWWWGAKQPCVPNRSHNVLNGEKPPTFTKTFPKNVKKKWLLLHSHTFLTLAQVVISLSNLSRTPGCFDCLSLLRKLPTKAHSLKLTSLATWRRKTTSINFRTFPRWFHSCWHPQTSSQLVVVALRPTNRLKSKHEY